MSFFKPGSLTAALSSFDDFKKKASKLKHLKIKTNINSFI